MPPQVVREHPLLARVPPFRPDLWGFSCCLHGVVNPSGIGGHGRGNPALLDPYLSPGARSCTEMPECCAGYRHCGPSPCPCAFPMAPGWLWAGDGGEEQDPRLKGEIICLLCPSLEKEKRKVKKKKNPSFRSLHLVTPFVERILAGASGKKQNVFSKGSLKRERGEKKPESTENPKVGRSPLPDCPGCRPFRCPGRWRNPVPGVGLRWVSHPCNRIPRERAGQRAPRLAGIRGHKSPILNQ